MTDGNAPVAQGYPVTEEAFFGNGIAATAIEKAKARRLEAKGLVRLHAELDSRIIRVRGKPRLVSREIYQVESLNV